MPSPILVATDFSARCDRAVDRALLLGEQLGSEVSLAHVVNVAADAEIDEAALDRQMAECLPTAATASRFVYPRGKIGAALATAADEAEAGIVVMGVARHNALGDYFLGTAADHVLRHCRQPVLVVKRRPRGPYRNIGVATDFSEPSLNALLRAAELFPDAPLHLIHAFRVPFEGWQKAEPVRDKVRDAEAAVFDEYMSKVPADVARRVTKHMPYGGLHKAITSVVEAEQLDLLVLGSHGESGFRHAALGSQANALLLTSTLDTMVISPVTA